MTPASARALLLFLPLVTACEGRELSVFELPGKAGAGSTADFAGSVGTDKGGSAAGVSNAGSGGGGAAGAGGAAGGGAGGSLGGSTVTSAGMAGAAGAGAPVPCVSDQDCAGWICDKPGCQATSGICVPYPPVCPADLKPVCGCDGVTYWNDCIRLKSGAQVAGPDVCRGTACACEVASDCNVPYASCAHLIGPGEMCGHAMGSCWVLPPQCGPSADSKMWRECKPPDPGVPPKCLDTCEAIATEHSYAELHRGDTCN